MAILCCATLITGFGLAALQFAYESNPAWPPVIIPAVIAAVPNLILIHRSSVGISLAPPVMLLSTLFVVTISHTGMEWTLLLGTAFWSWISYRTAISSKFSPTVARLSAIPSALTALFHAIFGLAYVGTMRSVGDSYIASSEQSSLLMQDGELSNLTTTFFMNELNASLPMHYALSFLIVSSGATLLSSWLALIHHRSPEDQ